MQKKFCEYCGKPLSENCGCHTELEKKVKSLEQEVLDMKMKILEYEYEDLRKKLLKCETEQKISDMMENAKKWARKNGKTITGDAPGYEYQKAIG